MINDNDLNLNFIFNKKYELTEKSLNEVAEQIQKKYGVQVVEILETEDGYVFKGEYGFTIGDLTYDSKMGRYKGFNFHRGVVESINEKRARINESRRVRKYKMQRNKRIGVAITAAGMVVLVGIGVIKGITNANENVSSPDSSIVSVVDREPLNTINSANDLILVAWLNYAMGEVSSYCEQSEIVPIQEMRDSVYTNSFAPAMMNYYNYLDYIGSPLPEEIIGSSIQNAHLSFRNSVLDFNANLKDINLDSFVFSKSPFANAIVLDADGNELVCSIRFDGEVETKDGVIVGYDENQSYDIYVRAVDIPNNNYSITNLPTDAKIINGETYVLYSHMYGKSELDSKSK